MKLLLDTNAYVELLKGNVASPQLCAKPAPRSLRTISGSPRIPSKPVPSSLRSTGTSTTSAACPRRFSQKTERALQVLACCWPRVERLRDNREPGSRGAFGVDGQKSSTLQASSAFLVSLPGKYLFFGPPKNKCVLDPPRLPGSLFSRSHIETEFRYGSFCDSGCVLAANLPAQRTRSLQRFEQDGDADVRIRVERVALFDEPGCAILFAFGAV